MGLLSRILRKPEPESLSRPPRRSQEDMSQPRHPTPTPVKREVRTGIYHPMPPAADEPIAEFATQRLAALREHAVNPTDRRCLDGMGDCIASGHLDIPVLPEVAGMLLSLDGSSELDNDEVADLIQRDQALSAQILRHANAPTLGAGRIQSLDQSVSMLGFEMVRSLAVAAAVGEDVFRVPGYDVETRALQDHSSEVAETAASLARGTGVASPGDAYMAGLFHDVGKVVAYRNLSALRTKTRGGRPSELLARKMIDELHPLLGLCFAEARELPELLRWSVGHHHVPGRVPEHHRMIVGLVGFAELVTEEPERIEAFEDDSDPALADPELWPAGMPDIATLLGALPG
ncbi:MAG: HDOD domain-containing protein [bacterium]|nr:HDOD domain-containing protein [bacterium]